MFDSRHLVSRAELLRPPNGSIANLRGQGPRAEARGAAAAAHTAGQQRVTCGRRDTVLVLFGPGASAPDRSRAATGSAMS
jgi:hypothetical protein